MNRAIIEQSADDLKTTAEAFSRIAIELHAASRALYVDSEGLRQTAIGLQAEAMRAAMAALTARAVSERLSTIARIDSDQEAAPD